MAGTGEHREVEVTLEVGEGWAVPDLASALREAGVLAVSDPVEHSLEAVYVDTADLRLLQARTTLRRRTGGTDAGWHLKLPAAAAAGPGEAGEDGATERTEVHAPLGRSASPPRALASLVTALARTAPLVPVARLHTARTARLLLGAPGPDGEPVVLAEVADDAVTARVPGAAPTDPPVVHTWRELEVELVEGDPPLLAAVTAALRRAGARPSRSPSKLRRVLGDRLPAPAAEPTADRRGPAGAVLALALHRDVARLLAADPAARRGEAGGVHDLRVALRRLRSALATWAPLLRDGAGEELRERLGALSGELAPLRDAQVARAHLLALAATQDPAVVPPATAAALRRRLDADVAAGLRRARAALEAPRHARLLEDLVALATDPPLAPAASEAAEQVLRARVRREVRRARRRLRAAGRAAGGPERVAAQHAARRAARRARYAAEVAALVVEDAARTATALEAVQSALGAVQDAAVARAALQRAARGASAPVAFGLGHLHALQEQRAQQGVAAAEPAWAAVRRGRARRWLR